MTKKVLLINPRNLAWTGAVTLPLNLAYLASSLRQAGHEVKCLDMRIDQNADVQKICGGFDIVGISSCTPSIKEAWRIAGIVKKEGKTVVLGGPHPSAMPEESLQKEAVDIVARGEGEETIKEICKEEDLNKIKGISFKMDGRILHNADRPFIQNLDDLPFPARDMFDLKKYHSDFHKNKIIGDILTSRGCPCNCNFCYKSIFGRFYRMRSPENIIQEWKEMIDMGIEEINIMDDNFSVNQERAIRVCNMIIDKELKIDWNATGGLRVDSISKELLTVMKKSGCYRVAFGAESGSQGILDKIGKNIKLEQIENAVKLSKEVGIEVTLFFIIGNLYENERTIQKTINFAKKLDPDYVQFTVATPYPGTRLYETVKKEGKILVDDWERFGSYEGKAYFEHGELTKELVESMYKKAYKEYYMRPKIILRYLKKHKLDAFKGLRFLK